MHFPNIKTVFFFIFFLCKNNEGSGLRRNFDPQQPQKIFFSFPFLFSFYLTLGNMYVCKYIFICTIK